MGLNYLERVGAKRKLSDFQESNLPKKRKVPGTFVEAFKFAIELINHDVPADAGQTAESVSVKDAVGIAQVVAREAKEQLGSLQKKHYTLRSKLGGGFNKAQATWKQETEAFA